MINFVCHMHKRWIIAPPCDNEKVLKLSSELGISNLLSELLVQRGITTFDEAKAFFRPSLDMLHDPFLMNDMDKAVSRIESALRNNEKLMVYGDYDVDGTTSVALVYSFFKENGFDDIIFYIPDRYSEGYGISYRSIDFADEQGVGLVIALDCGIKAVDKVDYAKQKGIDFIICDHHRPDTEIPAAIAVLDNKRVDSTYPYDELSGCGVGFKLIQAYAQKNNIASDKLKKYLDLVAISIASDLVPITGENRVLAFYGLKALNLKPRPGIIAVLEAANIRANNDSNNKQFFDRELTINDLVFSVGPRVNAAGRIKNGEDSVELLISQDEEIAKHYASKINTFNNERRNLDTQTTQEALEIISSSEKLKNSLSTVLYKPEWHKGVLGIVASRLTEVYYRPTIVLSESNGMLTGSARSIKNFDIYNAIEECSDLLEHFGGHTYAAGLSIKPENFEAFVNKFEKVVEKNINKEMLVPEIEIDAEINLNQITGKFIRILKQFAPFGPENMSPIFVTRNVKDTGYARIVGKNHIKMDVFQETVRSNPFSAIAFQLGEHFERIYKGEKFNICYHIEENEWNGVKTVQFNVKDISFDEV